MPRASKVEIDAAERMVSLIDGMDMIKFGKNGSVVTTAATKLARAYTGRKVIARCLQHPFFSYDDWFIGDTVVNAGVPNEVKSLTVNFNFNDLPSLESLFDEYPTQIACVILEPATHIEPEPGFLEGVKDICNKNGAVLIFDEMITGFRWDIKGAQHYYGVIPDLCTFGKGMANGFSVSALMGKKEIMSLGGLFHDKERVFLISTTHGAEMSGMGALIETIDVYEELNVTYHLWEYGTKAKEGINAIAKELSLSDFFAIEGAAICPITVTRDQSGEASMKFRTLFLQEMVKNKVLFPALSMSYAHGDVELDMTLDAVRASLEVYRKALDEGVDKYLVGKSIKPVFRRYNEWV
jgi:glutamate-1-semialdehyde 2,1-aminomutase